MRERSTKTNEVHVLREHHLTHIPELQVDESILASRFAGGCSMSNCDAACCRYGVFADIREMENILAHVGIIQRHMEAHQVKDPAVWFEDHVQTDADFPSGRAIGTRAMDYGCVFLDSSGRCTLQKAAASEGLHPFALKPFYCVAYPITVDHGLLKVDEVEFADRPRCCRPSRGGTQSIFEVCGDELHHVLGAGGVRELEAMAGRITGDAALPR